MLSIFILKPATKIYHMAKYNYMTKEGFDRLNAELTELKTTGRQEAAKAIAEAREKGDLSENAEYDAAKDAQGLLELKINELEKALANARVLDASTVDTSEVRLLTKVRIKNMKVNKEVTYTIVSESEANLKEKKISVNSPIGKGLLGKKVGEVAEITTPAGQIAFEILDISV
jgi:transcription elongation factor GreA